MTPLAMVYALVRKELSAHLKSFWIIIMGLVFAVISWAIGQNGFSLTGGEVGQETVLVSLVHLQLYIIPLLGLLIAYDAVLSEREAGTFDLHLSMKVGKLTFLVGKWIGLLLSLWIALAPSMVIQALSFFNAGGDGGQFFRFWAYSALLSAVMISLGLMLSSLSLNRGTVISLCLGAWLLIVVLMDFLVLGLLTLTQGNVADWIINGTIVANPLGLFRLINYLTFFPEETQQILGGLTLRLSISLLLVWMLLPFAVAWMKLSRHYAPIELRNGGKS